MRVLQRCTPVFLSESAIGPLCVCVGVCVCLLQTTQIRKWRHDAWVSRTISLFVGDAVLIEDSSHGMMHQTGKSFSEYLSHTDHWAGTHEWWYKDITIYLHTHTLTCTYIRVASIQDTTFMQHVHQDSKTAIITGMVFALVGTYMISMIMHAYVYIYIDINKYIGNVHAIKYPRTHFYTHIHMHSKSNNLPVQQIYCINILVSARRCMQDTLPHLAWDFSWGIWCMDVYGLL